MMLFKVRAWKICSATDGRSKYSVALGTEIAERGLRGSTRPTADSIRAATSTLFSVRMPLTRMPEVYLCRWIPSMEQSHGAKAHRRASHSDVS